MSISEMVELLAFVRSEALSCRRRPASIRANAARPKKTWIPACAGMTERKFDFQSTNLEPPLA
jgi:hypothetical protein